MMVDVYVAVVAAIDEETKGSLARLALEYGGSGIHDVVVANRGCIERGHVSQSSRSSRQLLFDAILIK